jgi:uncharacterized protein
MDPIQKILQESENIAVVGLSNHTWRPAYEIAEYLQSNGYRIIPVNPHVDHVLGQAAYPNVLSVPGPLDLVLIFRRSEYVPEIVQQAIAKNARVVWMQPGAENYDAADMAQAAGIKTIVGMCIRVQHRKAEHV